MSMLNKDFFLNDTVEVAKNLLGCKLVRYVDGQKLEGIIVETEAYKADDPACHASRGLTPRNKPMFKEGGIAYVYFIYGMYHCVNVVTEEENTPAAVLIRALEPLDNLASTNGPGKLCRELQITKEQNCANLMKTKDGLWIEKFTEIDKTKITTTTRIGIKQAVDYPWRFYITGNKFVSKK